MTDADRRSDWSGFRKIDVPPPPAPPRPGPAPGAAAPRTARSATRSAQPRKKRAAPEITPPAPGIAPASTAPPGQPSPTAVWIAAEQLEYLRSQATELATTKTQVFLDALEAVYEQLRAEGPAVPPRTILPPRPPLKRGRVEGGSPASLYLTPAEREVVDGLATELRLTRSALVSRVLDRARNR